MTPHEVKVRINGSAREIEIVGTREAVDEYLSRFEEIVQRFAGVSEAQHLRSDQPERPRLLPSQPPSEFGEYLQEFPSSIADVDRVLIAGHFIQSQSSENSFTTRDVNQALLGLGVKVSNPSESIRQNARSRRVFALAQGSFRVAQSGLERLAELRNKER